MQENLVFHLTKVAAALALHTEALNRNTESNQALIEALMESQEAEAEDGYQTYLSGQPVK